jgi:hypothetical protein
MSILRTLARYYVLTREQIQALCCADHASGRGTRKRLSRLRQVGYIVKHRVPVALPATNGAAPVYYPTKKGAEALASYFDDERFYATNTKHPRADRLAHWIAINNNRMLIEQATDKLDSVNLIRWVTEWDTINKDASVKDQYCLHTQITEQPPLSCSPDAGFLIEHQGQRMVYYVECDLNTSGAKQIAARKSKGYFELNRIEGHRKHFPETTIPFFRVLFITTSENRARAVQREMKSRPGNDLWFMINSMETTIENFFTGPVAVDNKGLVRPVLNQPHGQTGTTVEIVGPESSSPHVASPAQQPSQSGCVG